MEIKDHDGLFADTPDEQRAWTSHGDAVLAAPEGFEVTAETPVCPDHRLREPENVDGTGCSSTRRCATPSTGMEILKNFLFEGAGARRSGRRPTSSQRRSRR